MLELELSALEFMLKCFPDMKDEEVMRRSIGRYGLTGKQQVHIMDLIIHTVFIAE